MTISLNKNICYVEGNTSYQSTNKEFPTAKERSQIYSKKNVFVDNSGDVTLYPGINSFHAKNDILNSNFYDLRTFRDDFYDISKVVVSLESSQQIVNDSEIIFVDYLDRELRMIIKTDVTTHDGSVDQYGSIIVGLQNVNSNEHLQKINLAFRGYFKLNPLVKFDIKIENFDNNSLILTQKKPGVLGSIYVIMPSGFKTEEYSGRFSNENYEYEIEYKPYVENLSIKKIIKDNPKIFKKTLGINNLDYEEDIYFDDSLTKFNNDFYFESPDRIKYSFTYNTNAINSLSTTISPIETISILEGNITTEQSLLGIKGDIVYSGLDSRKRSNIQTNKARLITGDSYSLNKNAFYNDSFSIEPFNDEEYDDLVPIRTDDFMVNYEYQKSENNQSTVNKLVEVQTPKKLTILTNRILVYNEDKMDIIPFYERSRTNKNSLKENDNIYLDDEDLLNVYFSNGRDINKDHTLLSNSIAYYGEIE